MSRGPNRHEQAVLRLLKSEAGKLVSRAALLDALYPPGAERPASAPFMADAVVTRLRGRGHRIYCRRGQGYWMEAA